jgi:hypothetical protein
MDFTLLLLIILYCFAMWLGLYLIQRDWHKGYLRMAGLGLVSYAVALGVRALISIASEDAVALSQIYQFFIYQPALLWAGGLLHLLPEESSARGLLPFYYYGQILITELLLVFNLWGAFPDWALIFVVSLPIFTYLIVLIYEHRKHQQRGRLALTIIATIFFGLSVGLFIPDDIFPESWLVVAMGLDLIVLGIGIAIHDAFQEGHALRRSMWSSLHSVFFVCLLIGGQVALAILGLGISLAMLALLLGLLATGIAMVVFAPHLRLTQTAEAVETSARNIDPGMDFSAISEEDFVRYTRRALSYLDDLPKLASNPLTQLPLIEARLSSRHTHIDTLARTNELKSVLIEGIKRLKPKTESNFGTTNDWRYYNALYFPYVVGLKPSRRRQTKNDLADYEIEALDWFRREIPERTLHNWQNKAAKLIALDLREKTQI